MIPSTKRDTLISYSLICIPFTSCHIADISHPSLVIVLYDFKISNAILNENVVDTLALSLSDLSGKLLSFFSVWHDVGSQFVLSALYHAVVCFLHFQPLYTFYHEDMLDFFQRLFLCTSHFTLICALLHK